MNKEEFEQRIGGSVSDRDYAVIDKVYTWHPAIDDVTGKEQIATLYKAGGMLVIRNMEEMADTLISLEKEEMKIRALLDKIHERKERVESGNLEYERCRAEMESASSSWEDEADYEADVNIISRKYSMEMMNEVRADLNI